MTIGISVEAAEQQLAAARALNEEARENERVLERLLADAKQQVQRGITNIAELAHQLEQARARERSYVPLPKGPVVPVRSYMLAGDWLDPEALGQRAYTMGFNRGDVQPWMARNGKDLVTAFELSSDVVVALAAFDRGVPPITKG